MLCGWYEAVYLGVDISLVMRGEGHVVGWGECMRPEGFYVGRHNSRAEGGVGGECRQKPWSVGRPAEVRKPVGM